MATELYIGGMDVAVSDLRAHLSEWLERKGRNSSSPSAESLLLDSWVSRIGDPGASDRRRRDRSSGAPPQSYR